MKLIRKTFLALVLAANVFPATALSSVEYDLDNRQVHYRNDGYRFKYITKNSRTDRVDFSDNAWMGRPLENEPLDAIKTVRMHPNDFEAYTWSHDYKTRKLEK